MVRFEPETRSRRGSRAWLAALVDSWHEGLRDGARAARRRAFRCLYWTAALTAIAWTPLFWSGVRWAAIFASFATGAQAIRSWFEMLGLARAARMQPEEFSLPDEDDERLVDED